MSRAIAIVLSAASVGCATRGTPSGWGPVTLEGAHQLDVVSRHTGRTHRVFVSVPSTPPPPEGHPVLFLLDGNAYFPTAERQMHFTERLARGSSLSAVAPLVVALGYPGVPLLDAAARSEDYTPPAPPLGPPSPKGNVRHGGADRFLAFIEEEVKPLVRARWPLDPAKTALMGHSLGGLFALHVLFTRPQSFTTYVAGSPSIWWNEEFILSEMERFLSAGTSIDARLLLTVGGLEETAPRHAPHRAPLLEERRMLQNARALAAELENAGLEVELAVFEHEDHHGAALPMVQHGMSFFSLQTALSTSDSAGSR